MSFVLRSLLILVALVSAGEAPARVELIRWQAPVDGEAAPDGFRIHYGSESRDYAHIVDVGNPEADADGVRQYELEIPDAESIFIAMTSYQGGVESGYSNEVFRGITVPSVLVDVTVAAGLADPDGGVPVPPEGLAVEMAGGAAAGDYDGDGWVDLFVTRWGAADRLLRNRGDGSFEDRTGEAGLGVLLTSTGAAWGDVDNDGDLDLYVATAGPGAERFHLYINDGAGGFEEQAEARGAAVLGPDVRYGQSVTFGDYDLDGWIDVHTTEWWPGDWGAPPSSSSARLLRNRGSEAPGYFEDVTDSLGVGLDGPAGAAAFSSRFADLDGDGAPELIVAGDGGTSRLFWNERGGVFVEGAESAGVGTDENGTATAVGDYDGDGRIDWFVSSIHHPGDPCSEVGASCAFGASGNRLYRGLGGRRFEDATDAAGVREGFWGTGALFGDLDNDGDLDLVQTNGRVSAPAGEPEADVYLHFEADPVRVWLQNPAGFGEERALEIGAADPGVGRGILTFDYDRDGDLDLLVVNHPGTPVLYRNDAPATNGWLRVETVGQDSNRAGIGAVGRVWTTAGAAPQTREVSAGSHYLGQSDSVVHFGLGETSAPLDRVEVHWPATDRTVTLRGVAPDQEITVVEPAAADEGSEPPPEPPTPPAPPEEDETSGGGSGGSPKCGLLGVEPILVVLWQALRRRRRSDR